MKTLGHFAIVYLNYLYGKDKLFDSFGKEISLPIPSPFAHNIRALLLLKQGEATTKDPVMLKAISETRAEIKKRVKELSKKTAPIFKKLKISLNEKTKRQIAITLHDFEYLTKFSRAGHSLFIEFNRKYVKQRRAVIKHLEKAAEYPFLLNREAIKEQIEFLKGFDKKEISYHPLLDCDFIRTFIIDADTLSLSETERAVKLFKMLNTPIKIEGGRPKDYFQKALIYVIYKLLKDEAVNIEGAKTTTAQILTASGFGTIKSKDVDNALHS